MTPATDDVTEPATPGAGKGRPTPKRKDAQAANRRPLISGDPKADRIKAREAAAKQRQLMDEAMKTGDDRYLPMQHRGPVKRYVRDYLDSRFTLGELFMPVALGVVVLMFVGSFAQLPPAVLLYALLGLYVLVFAVIIEAIVLGIVIHRKAVAKFGASNVRGVRLYVGMRSLQLRALRMPKAQVERGRRPS